MMFTYIIFKIQEQLIRVWIKSCSINCKWNDVPSLPVPASTHKIGTLSLYEAFETGFLLLSTYSSILQTGEPGVGTTS